MARTILISVILALLTGSILSATPGHVSPTESREDSNVNQIQYASVTVNGRTLAGPNSSAKRLNGRVLLPILAVGAALGDIVSINAANRIVNVRRQTGETAEFNAKIGQILENGSAVLTVSNGGEIVFPANDVEFTLPVEIAASLFDASIQYDIDSKTVVVTRGFVIAESNQSKIDRAPADIQHLEYEYNLNRYSSTTAHSLVLLGAGRIADGRYSFTSNASKNSRGISIQNARFDLVRPNGHHFSVGDFGAGESLQFLATNVRGGSIQIPIDQLKFTAFGGRTFSGQLLPLLDGPIASKKAAKYDTTTFGAYFTRQFTSVGQRSDSLSASGGGMSFSSASRQGSLVTGNVIYDSGSLRFQSDAAYGTFAGLNQSNVRIDGTGASFDMAGSYQVFDNLSIQGRFTNITRNFLSPQAGFREPLDLKAAAVTWSPSTWASMSISASTSRRPGDPSQNNRFVTSSFALTPSTGLPRIYFSHTQSSTTQIQSSTFTTLNASKEFSRLRFYLNASRIKNLGPANVNAQFGSSFSINDSNSIEISQGIGSRNSYNGQFDWRTSGFLKNKLNLSAGAGYSFTPSSGFSPYHRLAASLALPRQTSLQINYYNTTNGTTLLLSLRGSLFKKREAQAFMNSPVSEMNRYGNISGRVYQDVDSDGKFDPSVDKPQADVKVRVDGNRYVVSDENGMYQFDSISAGDHKVYLDLLSVRADLTLLGNAAKETKLSAGHNANHDFRLVRTGRISGRVWLDTNENGQFDEGESPLADIRVVTASGRDTLTDADGSFTIGDLPPGEHTFFLDEKTLPEKTTSARKPLAVQSFAGRETANVFLPVAATSAEVIRFQSKQP